MIRYAPFATVLALGFAAGLTGCSPASPGGCETDLDCTGNGKGGVCAQGHCQECRADADCQEGSVCITHRCEAPVQSCNCSELERCENNTCVPDEEAIRRKEREDAMHASRELPAACQPGDPSGDMPVALDVIRFEFNQADLTASSRSLLDANAECLRQRPELKVVVEGHCDERGTQEYNLALGQNRAQTVRNYLSNLGIEEERVRILSKGENEPVCHDASENCYAQNRRVQFRPAR